MEGKSRTVNTVSAGFLHGDMKEICYACFHSLSCEDGVPKAMPQASGTS